MLCQADEEGNGFPSIVGMIVDLPLKHQGTGLHNFWLIPPVTVLKTDLIQ